jgi:predicted DNA-binding protein (UPF0251 family)
MPRSIPEIDADIAALESQRRLLSIERDAAVHARNLEMLRLFDDEGLTFNQIAVRVELHHRMVKRYLYSHGRSYEGRNAIKAQLASLAK